MKEKRGSRIKEATEAAISGCAAYESVYPCIKCGSTKFRPKRRGVNYGRCCVNCENASSRLRWKNSEQHLAARDNYAINMSDDKRIYNKTNPFVKRIP